MRTIRPGYSPSTSSRLPDHLLDRVARPARATAETAGSRCLRAR